MCFIAQNFKHLNNEYVNGKVSLEKRWALPHSLLTAVGSLR